MKGLGTVFGVGVGIAGIIVLVTLLGPLFGGIAASIVGFAFPYVLDAIREVSGIDLTNFQIGATLGFVAAFFKTTVTTGK